MKNDSPIIISRKRKKKKHAHHGGTWKIAYADFMTAMMAFFLVMWLISQSSTVQREMIADYFRMPLKPSMANGDKTSLSDSIIPGGGDDLMKQDGEVANHKRVQSERQRWMESLKQARDKLQQMIETDPRLNNFKSNIMLRLTNDGLLIQITDSQDRPMFRVGSELPESYMNGILQALVPLLQELPNKISLTGHTDSLPYAGGTSGYSNWELSSGRANAARRVLVKAGLDDERFLRVIGTGSRMPLENSDPSSPANRRISILVLSKTKEQDIRLEDTRMHRPENVLNNTTQQEVRGIAMDMNDFTEIFFTEAEELLAEMEKHLLEIDAASPNPEQVNAIFRAAHSLKGGAGTFGFNALQETTHLLENLFDQVRAGERSLNRTTVNLFLECKDIMQAQLEAYQSSQEPDEASYRYICEALRKIALEDKHAQTAVELQDKAATQQGAADGEPLLCVTLKKIPESERAMLQEELSHMGEIVATQKADDGMVVQLRTSASADDISAVLCFVLEESQILIEHVVQPASVEVTSPVTDKASVVADHSEPPSRPAAPVPARSNSQESGSIRVAVSKVDQIINQVGELIITQAMLSQLSKKLDPASYDMLSSCVAQMERNTRELQSSVMSIRMMPMDYVFSRFPRLVHDLGSRLNKEVELTLRGGSAELDKSLIERIIDPLTHLVRNSLDHGIEQKEERARKGKSVVGNLILSAEHHGGNIIIEVTDDGAGLNREKILAKARSQGMNISDTLSDEDVWMLIFAAGFSTAESVTDVSGRGVGMDVVRRNIMAMGGHVEVLSKPGEGTTIRIILPLTLAILDGMLVKVGQEIYVLPLGAVMESLRPGEDMLCRFVGEERLLQIRGEYLPLVMLRQRLSVPGETAPEDGIVVIVQSAGCRYALWVDQLIGQQQVVVKNLEQNYRKVPGVSAATILGDGSVALILDVVELSTMNGQKENHVRPTFGKQGVTA